MNVAEVLVSQIHAVPEEATRRLPGRYAAIQVPLQRIETVEPTARESICRIRLRRRADRVAVRIPWRPAQRGPERQTVVRRLLWLPRSSPPVEAKEAVASSLLHDAYEKEGPCETYPCQTRSPCSHGPSR